MKRFLIVLAIVTTAVLGLAACGGGTPATTSSAPPTSTGLPGTPVSVTGGGTYWSITPAQLYSLLQHKDFILADTDVQYVGEISGTDLFINFDNMANELNLFPADKTAKIVVYCTSGLHSQEAAVMLVQAGYTSVMDLSGGITAWKIQGYPTLSMTRTLT